jgi:hypothetical protein
MFFSPLVVGPRAAPALDALVTMLQEEGSEHTFTIPVGSAFEAGLMLTCTGLRWSCAGRLLRDMGAGDVLAHFAPTPSDNVRRAVMNSVFDMRDSVRRGMKRNGTRSGPAFSDALYGSAVAKVLNGLLALEVHVLDIQPRVCYFWPLESVLFENDGEKRRSIALHSEHGTAFAADILTLQYRLSKEELATFLRRGTPNAFGIADALFPAFGTPPSANMPIPAYNALVTSALVNVRREMFRVHTAVAVLMATHARLGGASQLAVLEDEIICMILRMV